MDSADASYRSTMPLKPSRSPTAPARTLAKARRAPLHRLLPPRTRSPVAPETSWFRSQHHSAVFKMGRVGIEPTTLGLSVSD